MEEPKNETFLTETEVSKMTKIALPTLRNQRFRCVGMPYYKVGRSVRYLLGDVLEYMASKRVNTGENHVRRDYCDS